MSFAVEILVGGLLAMAAIPVWRLLPRIERPLAAASLILAAGLYPIVGIGCGISVIAMPVAMGVGLLFCSLAVLGYLGSFWWLAIGWMAHGPWDLVVHQFEDVSHMPGWYAGLCLGFDLVAAGYFIARATERIAQPQEAE